MATASLTNTPTLIDDGSSASLTVINTGTTEVTVLREWASRVIIPPGRDADVIPAGQVTANVNPARGTTGAVTYYAKPVDPASAGPATVDNDLVKGDGTTKVASLPRAGTDTYVSTHHNEFGVTL